MLKYELKEKDLDIVQLQKEINELHLETKMLKARMPLSSLAEEAFEDEESSENDPNNRYVSFKKLVTNDSFKKKKEV